MAITVTCPSCSKTYQVKDDAAGKKFRCKACETIVTVPASAGDAAAENNPWDNLDLPTQEQPYASENPYAFDAAPAAAPARRGKKRSAKVARGGGMPMTVMFAIGCEVVLILLYLFDFVRQAIGGTFETGAHLAGGVCGVMIPLLINTGAIVGYVQHQNVIRWISVVLASITGLTCLGCGALAVAGAGILLENLPPNAEFGPGDLVLSGVLMILGSIVRIVLVVCLLLRPSADWFER